MRKGNSACNLMEGRGAQGMGAGWGHSRVKERSNGADSCPIGEEIYSLSTKFHYVLLYVRFDSG